MVTSAASTGASVTESLISIAPSAANATARRDQTNAPATDATRLRARRRPGADRQIDQHREPAQRNSQERPQRARLAASVRIGKDIPEADNPRHHSTAREEEKNDQLSWMITEGHALPPA